MTILQFTTNALLTVLVSSTIILPATAQGTVQAAGQSTDPNMAHYYHHRIEVQLVNSDPILKDFRAREQSRQINILVPPIPEPPAFPPLTIMPSKTAPNIVEISSPQPAGFQSNIQNNVPMRLLPSGGSTNLLAGRMLPLPIMQHSAQSGKQKSQRLSSPHAQTPSALMNYQNAQPGSDQSFASAHTQVVGRIRPRGEMLGH